MFNCKKLFKLQIRPPSLILLITASQDRWIFPSQSWEVRHSIIMMMMMMIIIIAAIGTWGHPSGLAAQRHAVDMKLLHIWVRLLGHLDQNVIHPGVPTDCHKASDITTSLVTGYNTIFQEAGYSVNSGISLIFETASRRDTLRKLHKFQAWKWT